jgi:hypothetical protein
VHRGLSNVRGNYRALLTLFGIEAADYKKFVNFLAAHDCIVDLGLPDEEGGRVTDIP